MTTTSFASNRIFYDVANFARGFSRSGEFSSAQAALLERHGYAYQELAAGNRLPANAEEEAFVSCCMGAKPAETVHEQVWMRYLGKVSQRRNYVPSMGFIAASLKSSPAIEMDFDMSDLD